METVVVGLDLATPSAEPVAWATEYCGITGDPLVAVVAYQPIEAEQPPAKWAAEMAEVQGKAERALAAPTRGPSVAHHLDIRYGDAGDVIADAAVDEHAATVVVGAHGEGGFHHLGLGSVAHHLAHHLATPLVVVPGLGGPLLGGTVVVGLDGSHDDVSTLDWGIRLAAAVDGRVRVAFASDPMASTYPHPYGATKADRAEEVVVAQIAAARQENPGIEITASFKLAEPLEAIPLVADEVSAAAIVVGRKGFGHPRGLLLGRVPAELPHRSGRPVAIVPRTTA